MIKGVDKLKTSFIFAETQAGLPDSRAAARIIEILDKYIGLKVEIGPLVTQAGQMEDHLKELLNQVKEQKQLKDVKDSDEAEYIG